MLVLEQNTCQVILKNVWLLPNVGFCLNVLRSCCCAAASDPVSSGLGSPEMLPSVLEQGTVDVNALEEADNTFLLQPTPQGVRSYCIIQRTRSVLL